MVFVDGETETAVITAGVTVKVVEPNMSPTVAVMTVEPVETEVALPVELPIVATEVAEELHATVWVRSFMLLSV